MARFTAGEVDVMRIVWEHGELVNTFCGGSSETLLCHMLAREKISPEELLELQRIVQEGQSRIQSS